MMRASTGEPAGGSSTRDAEPAPGPWGWWPAQHAWFEALHERAAAWRPGEGAELDRDAIVHALLEAVDAQASWLVHPCVSALTWDLPERRLHRDVQLAIWEAAHVDAPLGALRLEDDMWLWAADGGRSVPRGTHDLADLAAHVREAEQPVSIALDVWCDSIGVALPGSWAEGDPPTSEQQDQLQREINLFLRTIGTADGAFPACMTWLAQVTRVAVPLVGAGDGTFRSGCEEAVPGLVYLDVAGGDLQIMEALVHESAHRHLFMAEMAGPLVDPEHTGRYLSPLRPDPRPLRGILLAYHALAYICALYADVAASRSTSSALLERELEALLPKLDGAEVTLGGAREHLTTAGSGFFDRTREVAAYGRP
jgi:HEXXH motif-containing protein